jgi:hypothetical protein
VRPALPRVGGASGGEGLTLPRMDLTSCSVDGAKHEHMHANELSWIASTTRARIKLQFPAVALASYSSLFWIEFYIDKASRPGARSRGRVFVCRGTYSEFSSVICAAKTCTEGTVLCSVAHSRTSTGFSRVMKQLI